jgi:ferredoxin
MKVAGKTVLLCSCEGSMPVDAQALATALGTDPATVHHQLCRADLTAFRQTLARGSVVVACGQEAPLFQELAQEVDVEPPLCVDIRDRAGWSDQAAAAAPKMAALIAEAVRPRAETPSVLLTSSGRIVILGTCDVALQAAERLATDRVVQLVLLPGNDTAQAPTVRGFSIWQGRPVRVTGALGNWTLTVEDLAAAAPSSRAALTFAAAAPEASLLRADVVLDLSGAAALVQRRDGWISADPRSALAVEKAIHAAHDLLGEFEKPAYIAIEPGLCAHSRNGQVGCTRCLDLCPSSALIAKGDAVVVDAHACSGHGGCASGCPTGAIRYKIPGEEDLARSLRTLIETYHRGGGHDPVIMLHDSKNQLISALARHGTGLPARVLPLAVESVAAIGPDLMLAILGWGAAALTVLIRPEDQDHAQPLRDATDMVNQITDGLGLGRRVTVRDDTDPATLAWGAPLASLPAGTFDDDGKRSLLRAALAHLHQAAPTSVDTIALPAGSPVGTIAVDQTLCTLCMACAVVCPSKAVTGDLRAMTLNMRESACTQCTLCRVACPERAISLVARVSFAADEPVLLKQDEAYACIRCGKPFAPRTSIERMVERLTGHSAFAEPGKLDLIRMCEDCRGQ